MGDTTTTGRLGEHGQGRDERGGPVGGARL